MNTWFVRAIRIRRKGYRKLFESEDVME